MAPHINEFKQTRKWTIIIKNNDYDDAFCWGLENQNQFFLIPVFINRLFLSAFLQKIKTGKSENQKPLMKKGIVVLANS